MTSKVPHLAFAIRLKQAMIEQGFSTTRSPSGVMLDKLCHWTQSSRQSVRRYLRGEGLPNYTNLVAIADALNVCPGWLLFGGNQQPPKWQEDDKLSITRPLLQIIMSQAMITLCQTTTATQSPNQLAAILIDLVETLSQIRISEADRARVIRLALGE